MFCFRLSLSLALFVRRHDVRPTPRAPKSCFAKRLLQLMQIHSAIPPAAADHSPPPHKYQIMMRSVRANSTSTTHTDERTKEEQADRPGSNEADTIAMSNGSGCSGQRAHKRSSVTTPPPPPSDSSDLRHAHPLSCTHISRSLLWLCVQLLTRLCGQRACSSLCAPPPAPSDRRASRPPPPRRTPSRRPPISTYRCSASVEQEQDPAPA